ncbi:MAG: ABC transporter permease [Tistrella sp.]|uniref:ABC transporter permease n=1 Tax=Tistrella mobilis TaxID=171437 RepID=A0A162K1N7_9PROT|nr:MULTISPECIES: ABC transporter substrate-binding protein [Tistrella]KYO50299.1 ABC transporter permease [Tistrella mobilis]MAD35288.1 ABC transporter permease [Tistrella sp.]MBA75224.1 ABC transporter permease [Tistrella sp.]HAE51465.1 ABC transporter permease [Tistrella mobilis]
MNTRNAIAAAVLATMTGLAAGAAQAEISDNVVRIGVLNDQSGIYADVTGQASVIAARMAVEDYGGKVKGVPVEVIFADHQNKPDIGSNIANQWYDRDGVDVIVDVPTSSVGLAVQNIAKEKGKLHLNAGAGTSDLTSKACSPTGIHYVYDTYALATGTGSALVGQGAKKWYFITADYAFGHALERDTTNAVNAAGGEVVGGVRAPFPTTDFSSFLLQAQGSGADVIGLANAGGDTVNSIKQASEFGITQGGQKLAGLLVFINDIHALGLQVAQGLVVTTGYYWDMNDETRAFAKRFQEKAGKMPNMLQAGIYSGVTQYLKAIEATGSDDGKTVADQMKATPINDFFAKNGHIRPDGRMVHDMYLVEVKKPEESKGPWDYYKVLATIPGDQAFRPMDKGECPLVKK